MATNKPPVTDSQPTANALKKSIEIAGKEELLETVREGPIGEADFGLDLVDAQISAAPNVGIEGLSFSIGAGAGAEISVFNSVDDNDPEGIVAPVNKQKKEADPPILAAGSGAWLKYRLWANAKATGTFKNPFLTSSLTGSRELALCDYRSHHASQPVRAALLADLGSLRLVTRAKDVADLGTGDALALRAAGELKFALSLRWSDVLSSNLGGFLARLSPNQLVGIKTSVGASVAATVTAKDEFLLAFVGLSGDRIGVSLRKVDQTIGKFEGEVGVKVELADPKATKKLLEGLIQAAIGSQVDQVDAMLAKTDLSQLSTTEQKVVTKLIEVFGLEPAAVAATRMAAATPPSSTRKFSGTTK